MTKRIIFVGYMGAGKSTAAADLERITGLKSADLDEMLTKRWGQSIASYFSIHGEDKFREAEAELLRDLLLGNDHRIIACGGGGSCSDSAKELLKKSGHVVHLDVPFEMLVDRLKHDSTRPLLPQKSGVLDEEMLRSHWKSRMPCYDWAHEVLKNPPVEEDFLRWSHMLNR